jgi:predicted unusual protein kinase regulating ubiquinone biosynthesis (AarF/ABC1/UbiB family)
MTGRILIWRPLRIWWLALRLALGLWWDGQGWTYPGGCTPSRRAARSRRRSRWLTEQFLALGSAFIKLGQLLSARPDVLPAELVEELAALQDRVPAFSFAVVQELLEEELGERCA